MDLGEDLVNYTICLRSCLGVVHCPHGKKPSPRSSVGDNMPGFGSTTSVLMFVNSPGIFPVLGVVELFCFIAL